MTITLARAARRIDVVDAPGLSPRAVRHVLATMAQIAQDDGSFRWGLSVRKVSAAADLSPSVVERAQRWLRRHGFLEVVRAGGGRAANLFRIVVEKLFPSSEQPDPGRLSDRRLTAEPQPDDGGQDHEQVVQGFSPPNPRGAGESSPPASNPPSGRCEHGRKSCRRCGTSPRGRARVALVAAEQGGRACRMCVGAGPARGGGTYWVRAVPGTQTAITPDQPCDHRAPTQHDDQPCAGNGRALALAVARALPATRAATSRRDWRGRRTTERTPA